MGFSRGKAEKSRGKGNLLGEGDSRKMKRKKHKRGRKTIGRILCVSFLTIVMGVMALTLILYSYVRKNIYSVADIEALGNNPIDPARKNDKKDMGIKTGLGLENVGLTLHLVGDLDSRVIRISAVD